MSYVQLPAYICHKVVHAAKITMIALINGGAATMSFEGIDGTLTVSSDFMSKHQPEVGGYFVIYQDGYESWSPAEAFESGYTPVVPSGDGNAPGATSGGN